MAAQEQQREPVAEGKHLGGSLCNRNSQHAKIGEKGKEGKGDKEESGRCRGASAAAGKREGDRGTLC